MFKKALIATTVFAATSGIALANGGTFAPPSALPHHVGSFYIGASISRDRGHYEAEELASYLSQFQDITVGTNSKFTKFDWSGEGIGGELFAGYGVTFVDHYYLALEGFGDISSNRASFSKTVTILNPLGFRNANGTATTSARIKQQWSAGVSVLPGVKITDNTLLYARIGWIISQFKLNGLINAVDFNNINAPPMPTIIPVSNNRSRDLNGLQLGLGFEAMVTKRVGIRGEWDWSRFARFDATVAQPNIIPAGLLGPGSVNFVDASSIKHPTNDQFKFGVDYHFNMA